MRKQLLTAWQFHGARRKSAPALNWETTVHGQFNLEENLFKATTRRGVDSPILVSWFWLQKGSGLQKNPFDDARVISYVTFKVTYD
jgi:hypothetical protein